MINKRFFFGVLLSLHLSAAAALAEKEILKAALDDGILTQAQQNAESYMERLFLGLGYTEVIFVEAEGTPVPSSTP